MAIKNYNYVLDSTTPQSKSMKLKIKKNICQAFVKQRRFGKAIEAYEDIMNDTPEFEAGYNLIVCLYTLNRVGDESDKMRTWFERLLTLDIPGKDEVNAKVGEEDELRKYLKKKW